MKLSGLFRLIANERGDNRENENPAAFAAALGRSAALGLLLLAVPARATVPEPSTVVYGSIALDGRVITAADTGVFVEARRTPTGAALATYQMGSKAAAGNLYSLRIDTEAFAPVANANACALGETVFLVVRDATGAREQQTLTLLARGQFVRLDFGDVDSDADGLPDKWELLYFGSSTGGDPAADTDGDGRPNLREFIQGTDPLVADGQHPADIQPADDRLTITEVTTYALAWQIGEAWSIEPTNIPISYVTRAGALWMGGEAYVFANDPPTNAPMWWVNPPVGEHSENGAPARGRPAVGLMSAKNGVCAVVREVPLNHRVGQPLAVSLTATPDSATRAYAVEESVPANCAARNISDGGRLDPVNKKVKWGPFFDREARRLTYQLAPGGDGAGTIALAGVGSFDGLNVAVEGPTRVYPAGQAPAPLFVAALGGESGWQFQLKGEPGRRYVIETSSDLVNWALMQEAVVNAAGFFNVPAGDGAAPGCRFFRARLSE